MTTPTFTARQLQLIALIADRRGLSYAEIGAELSISPHTVRAMVVAIAAKVPVFVELPPRWQILAYWRAEHPDTFREPPKSLSL